MSDRSTARPVRPLRPERAAPEEPTATEAAPTQAAPAEGLLLGADGRWRCAWSGIDPLYQRYHDEEWGRPLITDAQWFEKCCLESFQSGLSWIMVLRKRENFRRAFAGFDLDRVARFNDEDVERLLGDAGIIRHRGKIASAIANAKVAKALRDEFGSLRAYFTRWVTPAEERPASRTWPHLRATTTSLTAKALSSDLKRRGWVFFGPTTAYALMQSSGLVNDHVDGCCSRIDCSSTTLAD